MKRLIGVMIVAFAFSQFSLFAADDAPKTQFFGGLSILSGKSVDRVQAPGWQGGITGNLNSTLGIVGDFSGNYNNGHFYTYLGGPRFHARREKTTMFAHALFGGLTAGNGLTSVSGFTMGYGGGVDMVVNDQMSVRLVQFDWLPTHIGGYWDKNTVRFGFGLVFGK
jgi:hypothetical protein